jgi:hypothetical protein
MLVSINKKLLAQNSITDLPQTRLQILTLLPLLFKSLLPGQEDCVFFGGYLNLHEKPETGIPYREKNYNN